MTKQWAQKTLENLLTLNRSGYWGDESSSKARPIQVKVIRNADLTKHNSIKGFAARYFSPREAANAELQIGDIAMSSSGDVGKSWLVDEPGYTASNFIRILRPDGNYIMPGFLRYVLESDLGQAALTASTTGTTIQNLQKTFYSMLTIPLPSLAEQQRIVRLLDEAFEGLAIAKANAERNLQNSRAIFESHLHSAFAQKSEYWQSKDFEGCIQSVQYTRKVQRKQFLIEGNFPIMSQEAEFINGFWDDQDDLFEVVRPVVIFGDHTRVLKYVDFSFVLGADGVKILPPREFLNPKFFFYQLLGTGIRSLGYSRHYRLLKEIKIHFPSLEEQAKVVSRLDEIADHSQALATTYEQKIAALDSLKESIIDQLLMDSTKAA